MSAALPSHLMRVCVPAALRCFVSQYCLNKLGQCVSQVVQHRLRHAEALCAHISRVPWLRPKRQPLLCVTTLFVIHPLVSCLVETVEGLFGRDIRVAGSLCVLCRRGCVLDCGVVRVCSAALCGEMVDPGRQLQGHKLLKHVADRAWSRLDEVVCMPSVLDERRRLRCG